MKSSVLINSNFGIRTKYPNRSVVKLKSGVGKIIPIPIPIPGLEKMNPNPKSSQNQSQSQSEKFDQIPQTTWDFLGFLWFLGIVSWLCNPNPKILENRSQFQNFEKSIPIQIPKFWKIDANFNPQILKNRSQSQNFKNRSQSQSQNRNNRF